MSDTTTTPTDGVFTVRRAALGIRTLDGFVLPTGSVERTDSPGPAQHFYVPADNYTRREDYIRTLKRTREEAVSYLVNRFDSSGGENPWFEEITLTLAEANEIISILQGEPMQQARKYNFTVKVSYEVTGQVTAQGEEQAQAAVERLIDNMDDPGYYEPHIDGIDWEYIDVAHYETDDVDIEED